MAAALDQDTPLALEHHRVVLLHAPMAEMNDAGILALRGGHGQNLGKGIKCVAVKHRIAESNLVESKLGECVLCSVLGGKTDDQRGGHAAKNDALPEAMLLHGMLVEMRLRGVHDQVGDKDVFDRLYSLTASMTRDRSGNEIFKIVVLGRERRDIHAFGFPSK